MSVNKSKEKPTCDICKKQVTHRGHCPKDPNKGPAVSITSSRKRSGSSLSQPSVKRSRPASVCTSTVGTSDIEMENDGSGEENDDESGSEGSDEESMSPESEDSESDVEPIVVRSQSFS